MNATVAKSAHVLEFKPCFLVSSEQVEVVGRRIGAYILQEFDSFLICHLLGRLDEAGLRRH